MFGKLKGPAPGHYRCRQTSLGSVGFSELGFKMGWDAYMGLVCIVVYSGCLNSRCRCSFGGCTVLYCTARVPEQ